MAFNSPLNVNRFKPWKGTFCYFQKNIGGIFFFLKMCEIVIHLVGSLLFWRQFPRDECSIHVFQEDDGLLRRVGQPVLQPVVGHGPVREVEHADGVAQLASQGGDEGGLAAAGRAAQQVPGMKTCQH